MAVSQSPGAASQSPATAVTTDALLSALYTSHQSEISGLTPSSQTQTQLAEAVGQVQSLQQQLAEKSDSAGGAQDSALSAELAAAQTQIAALQSDLDKFKTAENAVHAEGSLPRISREVTARLKDESGPTSRSASPGREQGELWRQVTSLQQRLQQVQSDRDHMALALQRLADTPNDTDAAITKLEHQRHAHDQSKSLHTDSEGQTSSGVAEGSQSSSRGLSEAHDAELTHLKASLDASDRQHQRGLTALADQLRLQQEQHAQQQAVLAGDLNAAQHAQQEEQAQHRAATDALLLQHRGQTAALQSNLQEQSVEMSSLQNSVYSSYSEAQSSRDSLAAAVLQHDTLVAELKSRHEAVQSQQHAELSAVQTILQSSQTDHAAEVDGLQDAVNAARSQSQLDRDDVLASLQNQLKAQHAQHQAAVQKLNEQLHTQRQQHQVAVTSLDFQRAQNDEQFAAASRLSSLESQQQQQELTALRQELQLQQQRHVNEVSAMEAGFETQADHFQTEAVSHQNALRVSHEEELAALQNQLQSQVEKVSGVTEQLEHLHAQHATSVSELEIQLAADNRQHQQQAALFAQQFADAQQTSVAAEAMLAEVQSSSAQQEQQLRAEISQRQQQMWLTESQHAVRVSQLQSDSSAQLQAHELAVVELERQLATAVESLNSDQSQQRLQHQEELSTLRAESQVHCNDFYMGITAVSQTRILTLLPFAASFIYIP